MPLPQVTTLLPAGDATAIPSISPRCAQAHYLFAQVIHRLMHRRGVSGFWPGSRVASPSASRPDAAAGGALTLTHSKMTQHR